VVYSTDSFHREDFIFKGRMRPHSLAGEPGAEVLDELDRKPEDIWLPKPRFSAFFNTNMAERLKDMGVTLCAVGGIATNFCVITTVMDALCHDFKAVLLSDCATSWSKEIHEQSLNIYRKNPLFPLFRVMDAKSFSTELIAS
jgi:nicotinamidase/pyrazinamidase